MKAQKQRGKTAKNDNQKYVPCPTNIAVIFYNHMNQVLYPQPLHCPYL